MVGIQIPVKFEPKEWALTFNYNRGIHLQYNEIRFFLLHIGSFTFNFYSSIQYT